MRGKCPPLLWLLVLSLILMGCGSSPPNNYYVLSAQEFPAENGDTPAIGVGPIEVPEYLMRQNLVYNHDENPQTTFFFPTRSPSIKERTLTGDRPGNTPIWAGVTCSRFLIVTRALVFEELWCKHVCISCRFVIVTRARKSNTHGANAQLRNRHGST